MSCDYTVGRGVQRVYWGDMLSVQGHLIWKESMSNWDFRAFRSVSFPLEVSSTNQSDPPVHCSPMYSVPCLLLGACRCLVSNTVSQPKGYHSAMAAGGTHQFYFLALWCQILKFLWQLEGRFTFLLFLSTSGNRMVAVSSLILSPKSLRKSHDYLSGSPWQWRKQMFPIFFKVAPSLG